MLYCVYLTLIGKMVQGVLYYVICYLHCFDVRVDQLTCTHLFSALITTIWMNLGQLSLVLMQRVLFNRMRLLIGQMTNNCINRC